MINLIGGSAYSTTGGIQAVNRMLVRELSSAGLLRRAFFLWDNGSTLDQEDRSAQLQSQVQVYGLNRGRFIRGLVRQGIACPRDLWICTHVNYAMVGLIAAGWCTGRVAVMLHAAELDADFSSLKRFALRRAGRVFAVSEYTKKKAVKLGVRAERVQVLLNGVDDPCPDWQPGREATDCDWLLFVGRMDERYKGQVELLDAMSLLHRRFPRLHLVFAGGGKTLDNWRAESERRGLGEAVRFAGRVSDEELRQLYVGATIFAMPSENEGFGLVYAEAMAYGIPCIGSDRDAAREVISDGETGVCVPAGNSTALADAIQSLLKSPGLRSQMGEAGRRRFTENFPPAITGNGCSRP